MSDLIPGTTYYWRVVLVVRSGTRIAQTFGQTETLQTAALVTPPAPQSTSGDS